MKNKPKSLKDLKKSATNSPPAEQAEAEDSEQATRSIDNQIGDAQSQQIKRLIVGLVFGVFVLVGVAAFYMFSNGMAVEIGPDDAAPSGHVTLKSGLGYVSSGNVVYAVGSDFTIGVHAEDFISETIELTADNATSFLQVTLKPEPAQLMLSTNPSQEGTKWSLDSNLKSTRALYEDEVEPGDYQLRIDHPYFEPLDATLSLERAEEVDTVYPLSRVQGDVELKSIPVSGVVRIDGGVQTQLPYTGRLAGGQHTIEVEAPGYQTITDQVEITNTQRQISRNYRLRPLEASIRVEVVPESARLTVDGQFVANGDLKQVNANQSYTVAASQDGFVGESRSVSVAAGQTQAIRFNLKKAMGRVSFVSVPTGADVVVNGRSAGQTPLSLSLQVLPANIEFRQNGFRTDQRTITPEQDGTITVSAELLTELQARLRELPPVMRDRSGIELLRFKPDQQPFQIGASRQNDPNQQADEALKTVRLTKHFYASRHEITVAQFKRFRPDFVSSQGGNLPVTGVTWEDAASFCNWASVQEGLSPAYNIRGGQVLGYDPYSDGYRLPTEAEWEWLARKAGRSSVTRFVWGDSPRRLPASAGNLADESARTSLPAIITGYTDQYGALAPVGSFPAEPSGLYDMSGNAREWIHDRYRLSAQQAGVVDVNPFGPASGEGNIAKGSSFKSASMTDLRAARKHQQYGSSDDLGFRVVRYVYGAEDR